MTGPANRGEGDFAETDPPVSGRDAELFKKIEEEALTLFSFDGLRRITGSHPETLSRSLERLEEGGLLTKVPEGYMVSDRGRNVVVARPALLDEARVSLLHTLLPYDVDPSRLIGALTGRWFDKLRWVGLSRGEEGVTLKWVVDDGSAQVDATFSQGQLDIDARLRGKGEISSAVRAAHQLVTRISRFYSATRPVRRLAFLVPVAYPQVPAAM